LNELHVLHPLGLVALHAALAAPALAQQPTSAQAGAIRQACRDDYQAHCASVHTGGSAATPQRTTATPQSSPAQRAPTEGNPPTAAAGAGRYQGFEHAGQLEQDRQARFGGFQRQPAYGAGRGGFGGGMRR
jgi:hypothetical protein